MEKRFIIRIGSCGYGNPGGPWCGSDSSPKVEEPGKAVVWTWSEAGRLETQDKPTCS